MPAVKVTGAPRHPGADNDTPQPHLRLAWGHDCQYVQVASLFDAKQGADAIIGTVNEWLKAAGLDQIPGREELNRLVLEKSGPESIVGQFGIGFEGFHVTLDDRRSVNQLISDAQHARNQAFGKDA